MKTKFAEWLAENHYKLCNITKQNYYWISESDKDGEQTTKQLFKKYKHENN